MAALDEGFSQPSMLQILSIDLTNFSCKNISEKVAFFSEHMQAFFLSSLININLLYFSYKNIKTIYIALRL